MHCRYDDGRIRQNGDMLDTCAISIKKAQRGDIGKWACHISTADWDNNGVTRVALIDVKVLGNF